MKWVKVWVKCGKVCLRCDIKMKEITNGYWYDDKVCLFNSPCKYCNNIVVVMPDGKTRFHSDAFVYATDTENPTDNKKYLWHVKCYNNALADYYDKHNLWEKVEKTFKK